VRENCTKARHKSRMATSLAFIVLPSCLRPEAALEVVHHRVTVGEYRIQW
jgi:hypothetical protein